MMLTTIGDEICLQNPYPYTLGGQVQHAAAEY